MSNTKEVHSKPRLHVSLSTCNLEYGRHVVRLHRRRRRRAYAPTSNTASHDNHKKINSWVSVYFPYMGCLWGSAWRLFVSPELRYYSLDSEDDFRSGCRNVSHQQQFFSELPSPGRSHNTKCESCSPSSVEIKPGYSASMKKNVAFSLFFTIEMPLRRFWINLINAVIFNMALRL